MVDKNFCMSSYLAFRYIGRDDVDFFEGLHHYNPALPEKITEVRTAQEIDVALHATFAGLHGRRLGLLLSGGMDSGILASYMPGGDAYTFRFLDGTFQQEELRRAEQYAERFHLTLHYVDVDWEHTVDAYLPAVMRSKAAPVHSIEPQLCQAAVQAKADGIETIIIGDGSDYVFGGMDQLLSKDWTFDEFVERYTCIDPKSVLKHPVDVNYLYRRYGEAGHIDFLRFMDEVATDESYSSYYNAFKTAEMPYTDPYESLKLAVQLDLQRIRSGDSKYLIRELFRMKYPDLPVPDKLPMPRPVDFYFRDWQGPVRPEFKPQLDMTRFTGNQKWQLWCLERFLNLFSPE